MGLPVPHLIGHTCNTLTLYFLPVLLNLHTLYDSRILSSQGHRYRCYMQMERQGTRDTHAVLSYWTPLRKYKFKDKMMKNIKMATAQHSARQGPFSGRVLHSCRGHPPTRVAVPAGPRLMQGGKESSEFLTRCSAHRSAWHRLCSAQRGTQASVGPEIPPAPSSPSRGRTCEVLEAPGEAAALVFRRVFLILLCCVCSSPYLHLIFIHGFPVLVCCLPPWVECVFLESGDPISLLSTTPTPCIRTLGPSRDTGPVG